LGEYGDGEWDASLATTFPGLRALVSIAHVVAIVANRGLAPAIRLRESYRGGDKVRTSISSTSNPPCRQNAASLSCYINSLL
jgi:hypothetical protein